MVAYISIAIYYLWHFSYLYQLLALESIAKQKHLGI